MTTEPSKTPRTDALTTMLYNESCADAAAGMAPGISAHERSPEEAFGLAIDLCRDLEIRLSESAQRVHVVEGDNRTLEADRDSHQRVAIRAIAYAEALSGALQRLAAHGVIEMTGNRHGCATCKHWWDDGEEEHHCDECAYVIASAALAKNPGSTQPAPEERGESSGGAAKPSRDDGLEIRKIGRITGEREVPWINPDEPFDPSPVVHAICDTISAAAGREAFNRAAHIVLDAWHDGYRRGGQSRPSQDHAEEPKP